MGMFERWIQNLVFMGTEQIYFWCVKRTWYTRWKCIGHVQQGLKPNVLPWNIEKKNWEKKENGQMPKLTKCKNILALSSERSACVLEAITAAVSASLLHVVSFERKKYYCPNDNWYSYQRGQRNTTTWFSTKIEIIVR